jgi:phospholipid/cholesterol/gamma-HCH transport system substrate-binding protein
METRSNHLFVGGVVLALLAALVAFIVWLSQVSGEERKSYDIFFQQSVEGLAKGSAVTFRGVPVGAVDTINLEPQSPQFVRVRINISMDTPVLQGTTATIRGVGFTGVSQIQLDPPERQPGQAGPPRREIACPETDAASECPYGVPVIPTKPGALGQLLNSAPEVLERVSTLTERLGELLGDENQESIKGILRNTEEVSRSLAERSPEIAATLAEARVAMRQAGNAAERFGRLADSSSQLLDQEGRPLMNDLRTTLRSAERSLAAVEQVVGQAGPGLEQLNTRTLPEVGLLIRDLRSTTENLRSITERVETQGVTSIIGGERLPDYEPQRK